MSNESERDDGMRARLSSYAPSAQLLEALDVAATPEGLERGQLWRAAWQDTRALLLVLGDAEDSDVATRQLLVAVVTLAEQPAKDSSIAFLAASTTCFHEVTVWPSLTARIGTHVLLTLVEDSEETANLAVKVTSVADSLVGLGAVDAFDPSARLVAELADDLSALAEAPTVRVADPGARTRLWDALPGTPGEQLKTLTVELGLRQDQAMALLRDQHTLTAEQARHVEAVYELPPGALPDAAALPADVVRELDHPRWRAAWQAAASRMSSDEVSVKQIFGSRAYALAARETGPPDWTQRLALLLAAEQ